MEHKLYNLSLNPGAQDGAFPNEQRYIFHICPYLSGKEFVKKKKLVKCEWKKNTYRRIN